MVARGAFLARLFFDLRFPYPIHSHPLDQRIMAPHPGIDTDYIKEKARKDLLSLLEGVCEAYPT